MSTTRHDSQIPVLVATKRHSDARGWFSETFNERSLAACGIGCRFVQDNQSMSLLKGTVRGLHYQIPPKSQAKLVRVTRGRILDVAVDIRRDSPTCGQFVSAELSEDNGLQLYIPAGFAHGFCTLEDATEVSYKVSDFYSPDHDRGVHWNDPRIAIPWPVTAADAIVSEKDAAQPLLDHLQSPFAYSGTPLAALSL
ncbi:MAG: dTDP-4-dehydrorhamnose 3,5-epimerase [Proteobacteria bacterium SG_bin9]|nr:MAG: dTDP-4-dehydrorhamnose 3,5-epimerase [Proteobacteria bacterium SG_bin9]